MYPQCNFDKNMKVVKTMQLKIVIFTAVKNGCILHGRVYIWALCKIECIRLHRDFAVGHPKEPCYHKIL